MRIAVVAIVASLVVFAQEIPQGWFAFPTDARVAPDESLGSVAFLNDGPADKRVSVKNGHFALPDGTPIRFFGSNITFENAFPDKEVAPLLAKRMKQLGFNVLRFHHLDNRNIWNKEKTAIDPVQLDKLHWFIHCLNQNGIYVNMNLHVSWWYKELDRKKSSFHYGKALDRYYPPFIAFQKQYARDLLTAVSPYSHLPMTDDPGVFCVEINNENSIAALEEPEKLAEIQGTPWGDCLLEFWRQWLARKYGSAPAAVKAWTAGAQPLSETNMVVGGVPHFEGERRGSFEPRQLPDGSYELKLLQDGNVDWAYQMHFFNIVLKENTRYLARFKARCDVPRTIHIGLCHAEPPWYTYSSRRVDLTPEWQSFECRLSVATIQNYKKRFTFNVRGKETPATVFLKDIELFEGDKPLPFANATELSQLPLPASFAMESMWGDYRTFLRELDYNYSRDMTDYLKNTLKLKALVADTQANYGGAFGHLRESEIADFVDMHAYWQHPRFEPGHSWSPYHWTIANTPMVSSEEGGNLRRLSFWRTAGKPYTISEYDHPAPSEHLAEMFPMLSSFAATQDWDALYQFCFGPTIDMKREPHLGGYFKMAPNPAKMITAHFAALVFRLGLVPRAEQVVTITVPKPFMRNLIMTHPMRNWDSSIPGYPAKQFFPARVESRFSENGEAITVSSNDQPGMVPFRTQHIDWRLDDTKRGIYLVNAPAARAVVGYIGGQKQTLGDVTLVAQLPEDKTAAFTLAALDGKEIASSQKMLLSLVGTIANPGMEWDEKHTTLKNKWGKPPAITNFIPAEITLPGGVKPTVTALDSAGRPIGAIAVEGAPGAWRFSTTADTPTLWFYINR
ncbi:MAG: cellulase family glycosylhydrolase [Victivallales bacterium]|nr:cellulase family glycosylhydrolase [Victivallales bacterium]